MKFRDTNVNASIAMRSALIGFATLLMFLLVVSCGDEIGDPVVAVPNGEPKAGQQAIDDYNCGSCHTIPNVDNAEGTIGPPLNFWSKRSFIAGNLNNNPDNLIAWIMNPQEIEPGTAMPDLNISEADARNIAAFLFTLQ